MIAKCEMFYIIKNKTNFPYEMVKSIHAHVKSTKYKQFKFKMYKIIENIQKSRSVDNRRSTVYCNYLRKMFYRMINILL